MKKEIIITAKTVEEAAEKGALNVEVNKAITVIAVQSLIFFIIIITIAFRIKDIKSKGYNRQTDIFNALSPYPLNSD